MTTEETIEEETTKIQKKTKEDKKPTGAGPRVRLIKSRLDSWFSRKLWMTLTACALLFFVYKVQVGYLWAFSDQPADKLNILVTGLVSMTRDFMIAFAAVVTSYVGITGWLEWKHGTTTTLSQAISYAASVSNSKNENIQRNIVEEGDPNAPEMKPFGQNAVK